jgi:branched-chain amino acid transport system substrate-binding protein
MYRSRAAVVVTLFSACVLLAACGGGGDRSSGGSGGGQPVKIGLITVTDGPFADNGKRAQEGATYAVERINRSGGINGSRIELVVHDAHGDPAAMANIVRKLASDDKVLAVVGPVLSPECEVGCVLANQLHLPMISPGVGKPGVMDNARPYAFTLVQPDADNSAPAIAHVLEQQGAKTGAIIVDQSNATTKALGDFWTKTFEANGVRTVSTVTFTSGDSSFAAQVTKLAGDRPDVLGLAANPPDAARIALEIQRQGLEAQLLGTGILQSAGADFLKAGGSAVNGTKTAAQFDPDNPDPEARALITAYRTETGAAPTLNAAYAHDAVAILAEIIKSSGVENTASSLAADRDRIMKALPEVDDYVGMGGLTDLQPNGVTKRPTLVATVQDGKFVIERVS